MGDTQQDIHFLTILQHLLKIDHSDPISEVIWDTVESLVSKATLVESQEDSRKLLQSFSKRLDSVSECKCTCSCHSEGDRHRVTSPRRSGVQDGDAPPLPPHMTSSPPPTPPAIPPPPPPPVPGLAPPPPPPAPTLGPPPPPPPGGAVGDFGKQRKLPQQNIPKPKSKMRSLQWQKIPVNKVMGKNNIWTLTGQMFNGYVNKMDYEQIEDLFGVNKPKPVTGQDAVDGAGALEKKKKESSEVRYLITCTCIYTFTCMCF